MNIFEDLCNFTNERNIFVDEPMKNHTSFKTGGVADYFLQPSNSEELKNIILYLRKSNIKFFIMGNGTNLLVSDKGIRGVVIQFKNMNSITVDNDIIKVDCGVLLSNIAKIALENELEGFEFASGIPGSFGGAVCMNAGAYGKEMKDVILSVDVMTTLGEIKTLSLDELEFSYRNSCILKNNYIIINGCIKLKKGNYNNIKILMNELSLKRKEKQPLAYPSAGSTFKRPKGYFAGKLISDSGLKGYSIGQAQVSEKHAGFIINKGDATTDDILKLIEYCQKVVFEKFGVKLDTEVKFIGEKL